jgi:putative ABC transport system permease protein
MGLGLVVGIAALGVIAARSVVERRQQIGVLRALGFQKGMVQLSFLLESSFVALLGIGIGIALGVGLSYNIIAEMGKDLEGITYTIPWLNIALVVVIAYGASLLTTYLPARQAARVYPAEALRFE